MAHFLLNNKFVQQLTLDLSAYDILVQDMVQFVIDYHKNNPDAHYRDSFVALRSTFVHRIEKEQNQDKLITEFSLALKMITMRWSDYVRTTVFE